VMSVEAMRDYAFRTVSQITLNYRGSPLSVGQVGRVHGGDRLPWVKADDASAPVSMDWQARGYGETPEPLASWRQARRLELLQLAWTPAHEAAGLKRGALYLLRPDTYVALVDANADPATVERYFAERGLALSGP